MTEDERLARIEKKLDDRVVYKDVYSAEKDAFRREVAAMQTNFSVLLDKLDQSVDDRLAPIAADVKDLKDGRKVVVGLLASFLVTLIGGIIFMLLQARPG